MRAYDNEAALRKTDDELGTKDYQLVPEKIKTVKPYVPGLSLVAEDSRQGDASKEAQEKSTHERDEKSETNKQGQYT